MKIRWIFLPLLLISSGLCFLLGKLFAWVIVWLCEGNWYVLIDRCELWWEGVRMKVLLIVGVMIAGFFIFSLIMGAKRNWEGRKR